jgi:hypothetical protein
MPVAGMGLGVETHGALRVGREEQKSLFAAHLEVGVVERVIVAPSGDVRRADPEGDRLPALAERALDSLGHGGDVAIRERREKRLARVVEVREILFPRVRVAGVNLPPSPDQLLSVHLRDVRSLSEKGSEGFLVVVVEELVRFARVHASEQSEARCEVRVVTPPGRPLAAGPPLIPTLAGNLFSEQK